MNIAIDGEVFTWWARGGIVRVYREVLPRVAALRPDWNVTVHTQGDVRKGALPAHVSACAVPRIPASWRPWRIWRKVAMKVDPLLAARRWRRIAPDVFHPTHYQCRPTSAPVFCFLYDTIVERFPEEFESPLREAIVARKRQVLNRAEVVLCISQSALQDAVRTLGIPEHKCRVVPLAGFGAVPSAGGSLARESDDRPFILYVGDYLAAYKNFRLMLEAVAPLFDYRVVVACSRKPSPMEAVEFAKWVSPARLEFRVGVDDAQLACLYRDCAAFVYPSKYEGFGIPVVEALQMGAPVVCANSSSLPEVGGDAVRYFDPSSAGELKAALDAALFDGRSPEWVNKRCMRAARFSWDRVADAFVTAAEDACGAVR